MKSVTNMLLLAALLMLQAQTQAAEQVKRIDIYVQPYYQAAADSQSAPMVQVLRNIDPLLSSTQRKDIETARDLLSANNALLTPMTLMVLAIRLYDVGLRDQAVFWYYAAKARYQVALKVMNFNAPQLSQAKDAIGAFLTLEGPFINGYAFCDVRAQQEARAKAVEWAINNPYQAMYIEQIPALPGDRHENAAKANLGLKEDLLAESRYLAQADNQAMMQKMRKQNEQDEKYCWKDAY